MKEYFIYKKTIINGIYGGYFEQCMPSIPYYDTIHVEPFDYELDDVILKLQQLLNGKSVCIHMKYSKIEYSELTHQIKITFYGTGYTIPMIIEDVFDKFIYRPAFVEWYKDMCTRKKHPSLLEHCKYVHVNTRHWLARRTVVGTSTAGVNISYICYKRCKTYLLELFIGVPALDKRTTHYINATPPLLYSQLCNEIVQLALLLCNRNMMLALHECKIYYYEHEIQVIWNNRVTRTFAYIAKYHRHIFHHWFCNLCKIIKLTPAYKLQCHRKLSTACLSQKILNVVNAYPTINPETLLKYM